MKEFKIIYTNGKEEFINANSYDDAYSFGDVAYVEEVGATSIYTPGPLFKEKISDEEKKVNALIKIANNSNVISIWESKMLFGVKRNINNKKTLSFEQKNRINSMYVKYVG